MLFSIQDGAKVPFIGTDV